ncbi:tetratricopeptide repeat protein [Sulfurovum sp.]|uniref:tetratricopeptide repeat protein n=1 Tax=Sulfurovum sp. TaxID=1969726 RepID=UPI002867E923|nr:tetratricopeptide repeat protein [Sulfurovum sp.]
MKMYMKNNLSLVPFWTVLLLSLLWLVIVYDSGFNRLLITSDQLGYQQYEKRNYVKAAESFESLSFKGASYYRDGAFKKSKSVYQNLSTKEDTYNLGNAFVMLGDYDNAIKTYERVLKIDPNFKKAQDNLVIAKARKILKEPENDGKQGIGDMYDMQPDEVVYDNTEGKGEDDTRSADKDTAKGNPNWLDRLQTGPKDFLKNKFRYQYQTQEAGDVK